MMNWEKIVDKVSPFVVKIVTPSGSGTGFLCAYNDDKSWCVIATALHVVQDAEQWQQPIRIHNHTFQKTAFLTEQHRLIFTDYGQDSAGIMLPVSELQFPDTPIPLRPINSPISIGVEVGWLGFPSIEPWTLCFFAGPISARQDPSRSYLIDGVAAPGVSGGPVLYSSDTDGVQFVGVVSAYHSARARGETMPGLLIARDVSHFHGIVQQIRTWDEAKKKKAEIEAAKPEAVKPPESPPAPVAPKAA